MLTIWKFYDSSLYNIKTGFSTILKNPYIIMDESHFDRNIIHFICNNINNRIIKIHMTVHCEITVVITSQEGVNGLKDVLDIVEYNDHKIIININTPPNYSLLIEGDNFENIIDIFNNVIKLMQNKMQKYTGYVIVSREPYIAKEEEYKLKFISKHVLMELIKC
jgi:translation initiation factor 2 alpha subunit (eIF-2alpha)